MPECGITQISHFWHLQKLNFCWTEISQIQSSVQSPFHLGSHRWMPAEELSFRLMQISRLEISLFPHTRHPRTPKHRYCICTALTCQEAAYFCSSLSPCSAAFPATDKHWLPVSAVGSDLCRTNICIKFAELVKMFTRTI